MLEVLRWVDVKVGFRNVPGTPCNTIWVDIVLLCLKGGQSIAPAMDSRKWAIIAGPAVSEVDPTGWSR